MNEPQQAREIIRVEDPADAGKRLDVLISERLGLFSRSQARLRIRSVSVNGVSARLGRRARVGDLIELAYADPPPSDLVAEDIPLSILFENEDVVVIDKPQGLVVHPGSGNRTGTLVNALLFHCANFVDGFAPGDVRPGIVHRLDKDTSGVMIVAKHARAHEFLSAQFQARSVSKRYLAIVRGALPATEGRIETRLGRDPRNRKRFACVRSGGRLALTRYRVLRRFADSLPEHLLVVCIPRTGRTHQLRVHLRYGGAPILGDPLYGRRDPAFPDASLMLHARSLTLRVPGESTSRTFVAPIPERFRAVLGELQSFSPRKGL